MEAAFALLDALVAASSRELEPSASSDEASSASWALVDSTAMADRKGMDKVHLDKVHLDRAALAMELGSLA